MLATPFPFAMLETAAHRPVSQGGLQFPISVTDDRIAQSKPVPVKSPPASVLGGSGGRSGTTKRPKAAKAGNTKAGNARAGNTKAGNTQAGNAKASKAKAATNKNPTTTRAAATRTTKHVKGNVVRIVPRVSE